MRNILFILVITVAALNPVLSAPSYMWYGTYTVEDYQGNGCSSGMNMAYSHQDADDFDAAVQFYASGNNPNWTYNKRDGDVLAETWTASYPEIWGYLDFLFYSGHGNTRGPIFGCDSEYLTTSTDIEFGGLYLKWVMADSDNWLADATYDPSNLSIWDRWDASFKGVHSVLGHGAKTYDQPYTSRMSDTFWDYWVTHDATIWYSWILAQYESLILDFEAAGFDVVILAATEELLSETWQGATDDMAPEGAEYYQYAFYGTPDYGN